MAATLGRAALVLPQIVDAVECIGHGVFELVPCFLALAEVIIDGVDPIHRIVRAVCTHASCQDCSLELLDHTTCKFVTL